MSNLVFDRQATCVHLTSAPDLYNWLYGYPMKTKTHFVF